MADVPSLGGFVLAPVIPADGSSFCLLGISWSKKRSCFADAILGFKRECNDRGFLHEGLDRGEEVKLYDVRVVLIDEVITGLKHLESSNAEALFQETIQDDSGESLLNAVGLEENESSFSSHPRELALPGGRVKSKGVAVT